MNDFLKFILVIYDEINSQFLFVNRQIRNTAFVMMIVVMKMDFRKNAGIILVVLGMILTMDRTKDFQGIVATIAYYIKGYWPLILCFIGMYIITTPKKKKK